METTSRSPRPYEITEHEDHPGRILKDLFKTIEDGESDKFTKFFPSDHQSKDMIESSIVSGNVSPIDSTHMSEYFSQVLQPAHPQLLGPVEASGEMAQCEIKFKSRRVEQDLFGYVQIEVGHGKIQKLQVLAEEKSKELLKST
jgi:hypothetical protein